MNGPEAPGADTADEPTVAVPAVVPPTPGEAGWAPWAARRPAVVPAGSSAPVASPSPAVVVPEATSPSAFRVEDASLGAPPSRFDSFSSHYTSTARTPLPEMVAAIAVLASTFFVIRWALTTVGQPSRGPSTTWWDIVTAFTLQDRRLGINGADGARLWWAMGAMILSLLVLIAWSRRIGVNNRSSDRYFGAVLPLLALPGWWVLPLITPMGRGIDRTESITRVAIVVLLLVSQALFTRWIFVHKVWRSGDLPVEPVALLLWAPLLVAGGWYYGSALWTIVARGDNGFGHSGWRPTETMGRALSWATRGTGIALLAVLIAVTVVQHVGIRRDRLAHDERVGLRPPERQLA